MSTERTYLDSTATAPARPDVILAVGEAMAVAGNPSSIHAAGRAARRLVEDAREQVAALVGADPSRVTFTGCGTEANALALAPAGDEDVLLISAVEHPSVLAGGRFPVDRIETIPVDGDGIVDLDWLRARLARGPAVSRISVMLANNETGLIQPVREVAALAHEAGAVLHCDAVQAAGRLPVDIVDLGADLVTLSAHKLGGPQGVGAVIRAGADTAVLPLLRGGGQERSMRAGTENVAGIAGFGVAAEIAARESVEISPVATLRDWLEASLRAISPDATIFGSAAERLANTTCFAVPGIAAEKALIALDLDGVAVSSGSACSSGKVGRSHVLAAMGVPPHLADGAIRVSLGWASTRQDVERFIAAWQRVSHALGRAGREQAA